MIVLEKKEHIAKMVINRPEKHNALTPQMFSEFRDLCADINSDQNIHAVFLYGAGDKAFCAGTDLHALEEYKNPWDWRNRIDYATQIRSVRQPVIAAVQGWALGGGLELALAADIRIASENAVFAAPEVTLGWVGASGASQFLPRLIGYGQAMRLLLTGDRIPAEEALRIGLVEELVETGKEVERALELATQIASYSPIATQSVKSAIRSSWGNIQSGLQIENELMSLCFALNKSKGHL